METLLKQFGLSEKESLVYKTLLQNGSMTVSELALKSGVIRTSCQEYLRSLLEKGFINVGRVGKKYYYQSEDPDRFRQIVHERLFVVDKLIEQMKQKDSKADVWRISVLDQNEKEKRRKKMEKQDARSESKKNARVLIGVNEILLTSDNDENPNLYIESSDIAQFHKFLFKKIH